jgi:hypothetical protein
MPTCLFNFKQFILSPLLLLFVSSQSKKCKLGYYRKHRLANALKNSEILLTHLTEAHKYISGICTLTRGIVVIKALCYKPEGRGFDTR